MRVLKSLAFTYEPREDRILAAVNPGQPQAWACWLTRRLTLAALQQTRKFVESTSALAQQAAAEFRSEIIAFERDAAIASTAKAISQTPIDILKTGAAAADRAERLTIACQADKFRLELHGSKGESVAGLIARADLQRILQMLDDEVHKAGWVSAPDAPPAAAEPKSGFGLVRH